MSWTTPRTWVAAELVTASIMNTHVRDQLNFIYTSGRIFDDAALLSFGAATRAQTYFQIAGSFAPADAGIYVAGLDFIAGITGTPNDNLFGVRLVPALTEAASGTHAVMAALAVDANMTGAAGATTVAATVYIAQAPSIGATNWALWVDSGAVKFDAGLEVDGTIQADGAITMADTQLSGAELKDYGETTDTPAISAGSLTANYNSATTHRVSLNANITSFTISAPSPTGKLCAVTFIFTADGTVRTITWPTGTVWPGGVAPVMTGTNGKRDIITLITTDAGTTWYGLIVGQNL